MKIAIIVKRFSSGKDTITENFGREIRLAEQLRRRGHDIRLLAADYTLKEEFATTVASIPVLVVPMRLPRARLLRKLFALPALIQFSLYLRNFVKKERPELLFATGDPLLGIAGLAATWHRNTQLAYDLRDNYEYYESCRNPIVRLLNKKVIRHAALITAGSYLIAEETKRFLPKKIAIIPNGVDLSLVKPRNKAAARRELKLPLEKKIFGYLGGTKDKGVDILLEAFSTVERKEKKVSLLIVGTDKEQWQQKNVIRKGMMPYDRYIDALSAVDVLVIPYTINPFTRVMYAPYKLTEYMAMNKPIVCTDVGEMRKLLSGYEDIIAKPGDADDLAKKMLKALHYRKPSYRASLGALTWEALGEKLHYAFDELHAMEKDSPTAQREKV